MQTRSLRPRTGFTLIEIMVVIAIMAVLMSLLAAAVYQVTRRGPIVRANTELEGLTAACVQFQQEFGEYPPSYVKESDGTTYYVRQFRLPTRTDQPEFAILKRMWKRWNPAVTNISGVDCIDPTAAANTQYAALVNQFGASWSAASTTVNVNPMDGNQCMTLFLGGPTQAGWDSAGPWAAASGATNKRGFFYEFPQARLSDGGTAKARFKDPWGVPYVYFSGLASKDEYEPNNMAVADINGAGADPWSTTPSIGFVSGITARTGVAGTANSISPLQASAGKYFNPRKCQIITAGPDKIFGVGGAWTPSTGSYADNARGSDDMANFNNGNRLGVDGSN